MFETNATLGGSLSLLLGAFVFVGWGSLVRVTPELHAVIGFRADLVFRHESPKGGLARLCQTNRLTRVFVSELYTERLAQVAQTVGGENWGVPPTVALISRQGKFHLWSIISGVSIKEKGLVGWCSCLICTISRPLCRRRR